VTTGYYKHTTFCYFIGRMSGNTTALSDGNLHIRGKLLDIIYYDYIDLCLSGDSEATIAYPDDSSENISQYPPCKASENSEEKQLKQQAGIYNCCVQDISVFKSFSHVIQIS